MATSTPLKDLSADQCILLAVHYASSADIPALHSFTPSRPDALSSELVLRILLTFLPETLDPAVYRSYVSEVGSHLYLDVDRPDVPVDTSLVSDLDDATARKRVKKLHLSDIRAPKFPPHAPDDLLTNFLCHRAQKIDEATGMLNLVADLVKPFLERNDYIRVWFVSAVLPLLRLNYEYYPQDSITESIEEFGEKDGKDGMELLLARAVKNGVDLQHAESSNVARDMKSLVGPWMYGHTERKRRKLNSTRPKGEQNTEADFGDVADGVRKIGLDGVSAKDRTGHDWEHTYRWMVQHAQENFPLITQLVEEWDGPSDVDFGGYEKGELRPYLDDDVLRKLELQYAQAAFASCYAAQSSTKETIQGAHGVLARLAELLDFLPPPDLATSVESLPHVEKHTLSLDESQTLKDLLPERLLSSEHPLTTPRMETYMLLQMHVYTAYQLDGLGYPVSLVDVARLQFYGTAESQLSVLRTMLRSLSEPAKKEETDWTACRARLIWLWNWGIDPHDIAAKNGAGVLGKIEKEDFEAEMLKVFTESNRFQLIEQLYLRDDAVLSSEQTESILLSKALEAYDSASNGNKTRGGMKKANDIIATFRPHFSSSNRFREVSALIAATHALSFYSLILQHGVPFQPVSIRVSQDPIGLITKVLEQNPRSYTKVDDLIAIGQNLVSAGLLVEASESNVDELDERLDGAEALASKRKDAERRVTFMAIEAALREDDFETAYSYIVSRLTPSNADIIGPNNTASKHARNTSTSSTTAPNNDDTSWRAAFLAGRYRPATASPPTLRRLEQRTELLSLALLLAPTSALTDILSAWRRCEEEMTSLQLSQAQEEQDFDDRADRREAPASNLPGHFVLPDEQPQMLLGQKRREVGRRGADEDAPVSMFDLTRSAARAFSRNAFPLGSGSGSGDAAGRGGNQAARGSLEEEGISGDQHPLASSVDSLGGGGGGGGETEQQRVRRRDMVTNAVSGGLASGLGWVLGATPVEK